MYQMLRKKITPQWTGFILIAVIFSLTIWISTQIVTQLKLSEKSKIENYAKSLELLSQNTEKDPQTQDFLFKLIDDNSSIPVLLVDDKNNISFTKNISEDILNNSDALKRLFQKIKKENNHIIVNLPHGKNHVYYTNSRLLNILKYFPIAILVLIILFALITYWYFKTIRETEKSFLWAGMAKETAHQIGTPLSSLMGWVEILKLEELDQNIVFEIEKDVNRLKQIAERFSKIGSVANLEKNNLIYVTESTLNYLRERISRKIEINFFPESKNIEININPLLYSWVLENLIKNATDAMLNKGKIDVLITTDKKIVTISISDSGTGISQKLQKKIFEPGFTTKKRGWGLGLSLAKRIIEDYHKGKIYVAESSKDKGTTFKIILRK